MNVKTKWLWPLSLGVWRQTTGACLLLVALISCPDRAGAAEPAPANAHRVPVVYCTDLFHPHDDPDDHFDIATLFALPELDVKAILLDLGQRQAQKPGRLPVEQMLRLTRRRIPYATGLRDKLKSPTDTGQDQPADCQGAVELLLQTLQQCETPVTVIVTGSTRDVCAAFNRKPELLKKKIVRLYLNIGNAADGGSEWNVGLDPQAYVGVMRSGLPIYWCPCMPMQAGLPGAEYSSYWKFTQAQVLQSAPRPLQNFFIYALQQPTPEELDPIQALSMDLRPWRRLVWKQDRNMWCTASMLHAAGRTVYRRSDGWHSAARLPADVPPSPVFTFAAAYVEIDDSGATRKSIDSPQANLQLLKITAPKAYALAMRDCLRELLEQFPLARPEDEAAR